MNEYDSERSKPWNIYTSSNPSPSQPGIDREAPWKNFGTSMNAIFLWIRCYRNLNFNVPYHGHLRTFVQAHSFIFLASGHEWWVSTSYSPDFSVLMPGERYPTHIAQPAPLPCPREGVYWPQHENNFVFA
ncbi:hypothetical protein CK203_050246 [Vitis vinifera]|uniref:Uncharacterized protein n=1 Tax=Vitis vinifera TaxID=29760 RepID=A0A438GZE6_VITVI|nr:hypothetical protein CK203_050246 [Vitis vinifera]